MENQTKKTTEKLDKEVLDGIKTHTEKLNQLSNSIGELYIRMRDAERNFKGFQKKVEEAEASFLEENDVLKEYLAELDKKYPNGEIDLDKGEVTYFKE